MPDTQNPPPETTLPVASPGNGRTWPYTSRRMTRMCGAAARVEVSLHHRRLVTGAYDAWGMPIERNILRLDTRPVEWRTVVCSAPAHHADDHMILGEWWEIGARWENTNPPTDTFQCTGCRSSYGLEGKYPGPVVDDLILCENCGIGGTECQACNRRIAPGGMEHYAPSVGYICDPCLESSDNMTACPDCGDVWEPPGGCTDSCCSTCHACRDRYSDDDDDETYSEHINSYNYKPSPDFHRAHNEPCEKRTVYLGWELEAEVRGTPLDSVAEAVLNDTGSVVYLKEDSSINRGFELVTHPMTHEYARNEFPWKVLNTMSENGCQIDPRENGLHVHVNKDAFDSPAHIYRWLKFLHRNSDNVTVIARRNSNNWASWSTSERMNARKYAKNDRTAMYDAPRYSAINVTNRATFEVRVFAGSLNQTEVMSALDLVHGSVEYARQLDANAVIKGGWKWGAFIAWAEKQERYPALIEMNEGCNA